MYRRVECRSIRYTSNDERHDCIKRVGFDEFSVDFETSIHGREVPVMGLPREESVYALGEVCWVSTPKVTELIPLSFEVEPWGVQDNLRKDGHSHRWRITVVGDLVQQFDTVAIGLKLQVTRQLNIHSNPWPQLRVGCVFSNLHLRVSEQSGKNCCNRCDK